tara:strand:- start:3831 stop:4148 length:318 start_codon:yes stop_codon:yes gene_type:complete
VNKKQEQQINIELDEKVGSGDYANFVVITHSPAEFVMDFTRLLPGMPKAKVSSRIIMAPSHVKSFQKALTENIVRYEEQYGEISIPQNDSFDQYGVKIPEDGLPN